MNEKDIMNELNQNDERLWVDVNDIIRLTGLSRTSAYKIMRDINDKLKKEGKVVVNGKVRKKRLLEVLE